MLRVALPDSVSGNHRPHALDPFAGQAPGFFAYLRDERGLREASIRHYGHFLRCFEAYLSRIDCWSLGALSPLRITAPQTAGAADPKRLGRGKGTSL
jgi:hypothetical protein